MGILDEAIREHLELKRQHGAGEPELKQLEDQAFGPPGRPGDEEAPPEAFTEAPTEFMAQPGADEAPAAVEEEPDAAAEQGPEPPAEQLRRRREPAAEIADLQEGPEPAEPAVEEAPAMEHEAIRPPEVDVQEEAQPEQEAEEPAPEPATEERRAIADQPTELYDVEGEEFAGAGSPAPSEDELVEEGIAEPRLAPIDPLADIESVDDLEEPSAAEVDVEEEEEDDFFDEKRLSDELDQALEAPKDSDQEDTEPEAAEEPVSALPEEDLLEETPDFLEEAPEDDELWFEQKPPKDFDFDD
jgi:hypothetical protein